MKLGSRDSWLCHPVVTRLPTALRLACGSRSSPRPFGYYRRNRDPFSAPISVSNREAKSRFDSDFTGSEVILGATHSESNSMYYVFYVKNSCRKCLNLSHL